MKTMKNIIQKEEQRKKSKNPTTNYPKDSHKDFCKRCMKFNGYCQNGNPKTCNL